jgi:hypothetical protein
MQHNVTKDKRENTIAFGQKNKSIFEARITVRFCRVNEEENHRMEGMDGV